MGKSGLANEYGLRYYYRTSRWVEHGRTNDGLVVSMLFFVQSYLGMMVPSNDEHIFGIFGMG